MADENNKIIDLETLSHFKAKQDLQNLEKFKLKNDSSDLVGAVRYDTAQVLTPEQKAQARANIGVTEDGSSSGGSTEGAVRYDVEQALSDEDKAKARANIGATDGTWESMPDKPFGINGAFFKLPNDVSSSTVISSQPLEALGGVSFSYIRVGDALASYEETIGAVIAVYNDGSTLEFVVDESYITDVGNGFCLLNMTNGFYPLCLNITNAGTATIPSASMINVDLVLNANETGFYFLYLEGLGEVISYTKGELKKIDKIFLPNDITPDLPEGIVTTDENGLIPASMLPSYVDDVVEGYYWDELNYEPQFRKEDGLTITPESGKIYVDLNTGNTYRWSGSVYVRMNPDEYTIATTSDIDALFT